MAKIIRLQKEHIDQCFEAVKEACDSRLPEGTVDFKRVFEVKDRKAKVFFTPGAWLKMNILLDGFDKEVGWYGVASRLGEEENDEYLISDIVVYPQEVTATTVDMAEPEEMAKWRLENIEDERLDHLYMHGHSHVRMGTTPSGTDLSHQREVLAQMADDGFYIFMIYNKQLGRTIRIYDMKKNIHFEDKDIHVGFWEDGVDYSKFLADAKSLVKDHVYSFKGITVGKTAGTPAGTGQTTPTYKTPTYKGSTTPATAPAPAATAPAKTQPAAPALPAKGSENKPVQGMGWKGASKESNPDDDPDDDRDDRFWNYDDRYDEYYDPEMGWIPGHVYRQLFAAGYYD